jgi:hypothetical protein
LAAPGDPDPVCFLMASFSAQQSWERTLLLVEEYLNNGTKTWIQAKGGPKVMAFYESIRTGGDTDAVCCDRHMACAAAGRKLTKQELKRFFDSPGRRKLIEGQVRKLALDMKIKPARMQAILWVTYRNRHRYKRAKQ